jgi:hypothetical protein
MPSSRVRAHLPVPWGVTRVVVCSVCWLLLQLQQLPQ